MISAAAARRWRRAFLVALAAVAGGAPSLAHGQEARIAALRDTALAARLVRSSDVLGKRISIHVTDEPLGAALLTVARRSDLRLSYSSDVVPVMRRVTLVRESAPVGDVLRELLRGTDVDLVVTPSGYVVLVQSPAYHLASSRAPADSVASAAVPTIVRPVPRTQLMDRVLVMGTPAAGAPERELPSAVTVLTASQIAALGPASMQDLLRNSIPGVVTWDLGIAGPFAQIGSVRGSSSFTANYLKTYVDGVELASPYLLFAIDPYGIERIEVIRGPQGSALYGSDAISGVVHIVTRRGSPAAQWRPQVDAMLSGGTVESRYLENPSGAQRHSAMLSSGGGTSSLGFGGTYASSGEIVSGGSGSYVGAFGGARHLAGILRVDATMRYANVWFDAPPNPLLLPGTELSVVRRVPVDQHIEHETYGLTLDAQPAEGVRHTLVIGIDRHAGSIPPQREPTNVADALLGATAERTAKRSFRLSSAVRFLEAAGNSATLTFGAEGTEMQRERLGAREDVGGTGSGLTALYYDDISNTGIFGQLKLDVAHALFLTAGLRGDRSSTFGESIGVSWSPMLGVAYTRDVGGATVKLRSAYGRGIRPPAPSARSAFTTINYRQLANPGLEPETQSGIEGGAELYLGDRASVSATIYSQHADGLIQQVIVNRATMRAIQYQNVGRIENKGMELEGTVHSGPLRGAVSFALTDSRVRALSRTYSGDLRVGDRVPEVPVSSGQASLSLAIGRGEVTVGSSFIGRWRGYDWAQYIADEATAGAERPELRAYLRDYPSLTRPFLSIAQAVSRGLGWYARIDNLTNAQHNERDNLQVTAGRTMTVGLRIGR